MSGASPAADPMAAEFDVAIDGETYTFRKPGIRFPVEVGYRSADVRRRCYPAGGGALPGDFGIDYEAVQFARCCAILELYLVRADQTWPWSPGDGGKPVVDFDRFPPERDETVRRLGAAFEAEVARFRARGNPSGAPAGAQAVAGQPDTGVA